MIRPLRQIKIKCFKVGVVNFTITIKTNFEYIGSLNANMLIKSLLIDELRVDVRADKMIR